MRASPTSPTSPYAPDAGGLSSPHCQPGEQTWVEAELERRARGEAARHGLPGEPKLAHEPGPHGPDDGLPPEAAEARHRQGLTVPPKRTGTGFYYRNGDEIPPTHPDHGPMHLIPRQADGSFAAYYYCSKAELARGSELPAPPPRRYRRDGFDAERQQQFAEHLRDTASWKDAARLAGISRTTAYNLYNSPDGAAFRALVDEAFKGADLLLDSTALDRAVNGQEEIVYYKGERVGVRWKYDNKLLMFLLRARNPLKYAPLSEIEGWLARRGLEPPADLPAALDRVAAAEAEWGRTLPGEGDPPPTLARPCAAAPAPPAIEGPGPAALSAASAPDANDPPVVSTLSTSAASEAFVVPTLSTLPTPGATEPPPTPERPFPSARRRARASTLPRTDPR